jgi:G3E family GTPase
MPPLPVTVVTCFLGSGKTTLLNDILRTQPNQRIAVIVNEFGEIGIDQALVVGVDEAIFEINNGCLCCTVRGDLLWMLNNLRQRSGVLDRVVIETTGLAHPGPVAQTFFTLEEVQSEFVLDGVVTLIDAKHIDHQLTTSEVAQQQVVFGDVLLLNKVDLVSPTLIKIGDYSRCKEPTYASLPR